MRFRLGQKVKTFHEVPIYGTITRLRRAPASRREQSEAYEVTTSRGVYIGEFYASELSDASTGLDLMLDVI